MKYLSINNVVYVYIMAISYLILMPFWGCMKQENIIEKYILLDRANLYFKDIGYDKQSFKITSNISYNIKTDAHWIKLDKALGQGIVEVNLTCDDNMTAAVRTGVISVFSSEVLETKQIIVQQLGAKKHLSVSVDNNIFPSSPNNYGHLNILSNIPWDIKVDSPWMNIHYLYGNGILRVPIQPDINHNYQDRLCHIIIYSKDPEYIHSDTIKITQKAKNLHRPPTNFNIISPGVGYKNLCFSFKDYYTIRWQKSINPQGGAVAYNIYMGETPENQQLIVSTLLDTEYTIEYTNIAAYSKRYLKIVAVDASEYYTESPLFTLNIEPFNGYNKIDTVVLSNGKGAADDQLDFASDLYVTDNEDIYLADQPNSRIQRWKKGAKKGETVAGGNGSGPAFNQLFYPHSVYLNDNNLYISDRFNYRVIKWSLGATQGTALVQGKQNVPTLYINNTLFPNPMYDVFAKELSEPSGLFVTNKDGQPKVYVCDVHNDRIIMQHSGTITVVAGGHNTSTYPPSIQDMSQLYLPHNLFVDEDENIYIADEMHNRIVKWEKGAKEGKLVAGALDASTGDANDLYKLNNPRSVIVDECKNVYVVDYKNKRVLKFPNDGAINGNARGEILSSLRNSMSSPHSMFIKSDGNIYIVNDDPAFVIRLSKQ